MIYLHTYLSIIKHLTATHDLEISSYIPKYFVLGTTYSILRKYANPSIRCLNLEYKSTSLMSFRSQATLKVTGK